MIEVQGVEITEGPKESIEVYEQIVAAYLEGVPVEKQRAVADGIAKPVCTREIQGRECGQTEGYVVFRKARARANYFAFYPFSTGPKYILGKSVYVPIRICVRCEAREEGYQDGLKHPNLGSQVDLSTRTLTEKEKEMYAAVYAKSWTKGRARRQELHGKAEADASRYQMKRGKRR